VHGAVLFAAVLATTTPASSHVPDGLVSGTPHWARVRPVIATLPAATRPRRVTASTRQAAADAVASCDPARVRALKWIPTTARTADAPNFCVVLAARDAPRNGRRYLLGAAALTGNQIESVRVGRFGSARSKARRSLVDVNLDSAGTAKFDTFAAEYFHQLMAVTLDGEVVSSSVVQPAAASPVPTGGVIQVGQERALTQADARTLADGFEDSKSEQMIELVDRTTMTASARVIVGRANPRLDDKERFRSDCKTPEASSTLVLGCYVRGEVFVLRVDRPDLAPVMVVTTAHEMLHAAYERLPTRERARVDALLDDFYATVQDEQFRALVDSYDRDEPGHRSSELHSLVPTQIATLSPELERYYRRYFRDRAAIVADLQRYNGVFLELKARSDQLRGELDALKAQLADLDTRLESAKGRAEQLTDQIASLRGEGRIAESNNLVDAQNTAVDEYNGLVEEYNTLVVAHNEKVTEINAVAQSGIDLYNSVSAVPLQPRA
jgi:SecDF, P1 head subdomain